MKYALIVVCVFLMSGCQDLPPYNHDNAQAPLSSHTANQQNANPNVTAGKMMSPMM
jgi:predicted component of type VI protein secretion system